MLNNHEANLTDEEAAVEVARVAKTYPVVRLLLADQIKSEPNCLLAGDRCPCLRQSSLEALADSGEVSEQLLNDGVEYRARLRPLKVEGEPHILLMVRPIDEQEATEEDLVYTDVLTGVRNRRYYEEKLRSARMKAGVAVTLRSVLWRQPYAAVFVRLTSLCAMAATSLWPSCPIFPPMTSPVACVRYPMPFIPRLFRAMST